ncbi:hypothetical protein [Micromonospora sp. NPDC049900]
MIEDSEGVAVVQVPQRVGPAHGPILPTATDERKVTNPAANNRQHR